MEGAKEVTVKVGQASVVIPLVPDDNEPAALDDSNNSFDKIMRGK
jgi:hypothetical protein